MISRRRILSRSVNGQQDSADAYQCEGDVWFNQEKFIEVSQLHLCYDKILGLIWKKNSFSLKTFM